MRKISRIVLVIGLCFCFSGCVIFSPTIDENDLKDDVRKERDSREDGLYPGWIEWLIPTESSETPVEPSDFPSVGTVPVPGDGTVMPYTDDGIIFEKDFGTFRVLSGWVESERHSANGKFVYIPEGNDEPELTDNISVNIGSNEYREEELTDFQESIMQQYAAQLDPEEAETLTGFASKTPQGYSVLIFTVTGLDGRISRQYYNVADHMHFQVDLICRDDPETAARVAQEIVESFKWTKDD